MPLTPERLQQVPLFAELSKKELSSVASEMTERTFTEGTAVTEEGAGGAGFFIIDSGEAEVFVGGESKRMLGPGDHFGEIALLSRQPRTATIVAASDLHCYGLTSWQFRPLVENNAELAWKLLVALAEMFSER